MSTVMKPKFPLGQIVATPGALETLRDAGQTASSFWIGISKAIGGLSALKIGS